MRNLLKENEEAALFAISVDSAEDSNRIAKRIAEDGEGEVKFRFLSDPDSETINSYGIFDERYVGRSSEGIPIPAVYILDKNRKIVWEKVDSNYRQRPTIEEIRAELDKLKKPKEKEKKVVPCKPKKEKGVKESSST